MAPRNFVNGDKVEHRKTGVIGYIVNMKFDNRKGSYGFSKFQVQWENGTTTWVRPREVRVYR